MKPRLLFLLIACTGHSMLLACGRKASSDAAAVSSYGLKLQCTPRGIGGGILGSLRGNLTLKSKDASGFNIAGPVTLTAKRNDASEQSFAGTMTGHFTPGDPKEKFHTNYLQADLTGSGPINGASISLWSEVDPRFTSSAIYDHDGYRYTMDCSGSRANFPSL